MATDDPTDLNREADDREQTSEEMVWPEITGSRGDAERLTLIIYPAMFPLPTSPIDHHVHYGNLRAFAEQTFSDHYEMWKQGNERTPTRLVVNERLTEIRADDYIAADLRTWCLAFICEVLEGHADYLLDCGDAGEKALRCFDQFAATLRHETHEYKWMPGMKALNLRAEDYVEAFLRDVREVISSVRGRLAPIAWNAERQRTDEELFRTPVEQTQLQSLERSEDSVTSASSLSDKNGMATNASRSDTPKAVETILAPSMIVAKPKLHAKRDSLCDKRIKRLALTLRANRDAKGWSRPKVVSQLRKIGVQITKHAIKKHEEGKSQPRPALRRAYATIYEISDELFAGA